MMNDTLEKKIIDKIIQHTMEAMIAEGMPFSGVFFAGLMIVEGEPKLIEYNVRFGDPECQTLMMRMEGDLPEILMASAQGKLETVSVKWSNDAALCVVMAANGYPADYTKNTEIKNIAAADKIDGAKVFHAGTAEKDGKILSIGGRVLGVTARGSTIAQAQERAYKAVDSIDWSGGFCRRDIGWRALLNLAAE
jgi:phosphoribosylamine--glycine ligase